MKITRIIQQEKQRDRYLLFVDNKYAFSLGENALLESRLATGQELTPDDLKHWKQESADDKIVNSALRYAAMRLRSSWEIEQYLRRKGVSPTLANRILNKLSNIKLLDDAAFAKTWASNRRLHRPTSKRKLQQELRAKHVSDEVIEVALTQEGDNELSSLRQLVAKKRNLSRFKVDRLKLMQYLARQGYNYHDIKAVLGDDTSD